MFSLIIIDSLDWDQLTQKKENYLNLNETKGRQQSQMVNLNVN